MASKKDETVTVQMPSVVFQTAQQQQQALAAEMAELRKNPLDRTVEGGKYLGADGEYHDAEGRPVKGK